MYLADEAEMWLILPILASQKKGRLSRPFLLVDFELLKPIFISRPLRTFALLTDSTHKKVLDAIAIGMPMILLLLMSKVSLVFNRLLVRS